MKLTGRISTITRGKRKAGRFSSAFRFSLTISSTRDTISMFVYCREALLLSVIHFPVFYSLRVASQSALQFDF